MFGCERRVRVERELAEHLRRAVTVAALVQDQRLVDQQDAPGLGVRLGGEAFLDRLRALVVVRAEIRVVLPAGREARVTLGELPRELRALGAVVRPLQ